MTVNCSLNPLSEAEFHINAVAVLLCFVLCTTMLIHTLYAWYWRKMDEKRRKSRPSPMIMYTAIVTLALSVVNFSVYCINYWFMRIFPPNRFNYDPFAFCERSVMFDIDCRFHIAHMIPLNVMFLNQKQSISSLVPSLWFATFTLAFALAHYFLR